MLFYLSYIFIFVVDFTFKPTPPFLLISLATTPLRNTNLIGPYDVCCFYSSPLCFCWMKEVKSNSLLCCCCSCVGVCRSHCSFRRFFSHFYLRFDPKCFTEEDQKPKFVLFFFLFPLFPFPLLCRQMDDSSLQMLEVTDDKETSRGGVRGRC